MDIEKLEREVAQLPASDLKRFSQWFEEFMVDQWDNQIEEDIRVGRLDEAAKHASQGVSIPFPKPPEPAWREALLEAGKRLDERLVRLGITEDELLEEFKEWRRQRGHAE
jgi:hypothetical protein